MRDRVNLTCGDLRGIECPACGELVEDLWDYDGVIIEDRAQSEVTCEYCSAEITIQARATWSFRATCRRKEVDS